jgi:hypothetical protein
VDIRRIPGGCQEPSPRYYFDASTRRCTTFTYSGCGGNDNNFDSLERCEAICFDQLRCECNLDAPSECWTDASCSECPPDLFAPAGTSCSTAGIRCTNAFRRVCDCRAGAQGNLWECAAIP